MVILTLVGVGIATAALAIAANAILLMFLVGGASAA
jgi:hypothetical protein